MKIRGLNKTGVVSRLVFEKSPRDNQVDVFIDECGVLHLNTEKETLRENSLSTLDLMRTTVNGEQKQQETLNTSTNALGLLLLGCRCNATPECEQHLTQWMFEPCPGLVSKSSPLLLLSDHPLR